jgi:amidohydrolase
MVEQGFLQKQGVDAIFGLHTNPDLSPGQIGIRSGPLMARPDEFSIVVKGSGGHAAAPHTTVDPIVVASEIVGALQTITSRSIDPGEPVVVTVGKIEAGSAHNIIPEFARMIGTVRTFSEETAQFINQRMERIIAGITHAHGASYDFEFDPGYPALINTDWAADHVRVSSRELFGKESVLEMDQPVMAGEDFAFYLQEFPGAFFFLGTGSEESGSVYSWHHPKYNIDEQAFKTGAPLMASLALNYDL